MVVNLLGQLGHIRNTCSCIYLVRVLNTNLSHWCQITKYQKEIFCSHDRRCIIAETLSKFGVPLGGGAGRGGLLALKIKHRFRVRVVNFGPISGGLDFTQQVQSVKKPTISHEPVEIHSYNSVAYYAGKHKWESINLTLKDDITNVISTLVGHQVQKQLNHFEQTAFAAGINYKFVTIIETLDGGDDTVLETWTLEGCFLENVEYGELDYKESEFQTIALTIRYDNATLGDGLMTTNPQSVAGTQA